MAWTIERLGASKTIVYLVHLAALAWETLFLDSKGVDRVWALHHKPLIQYQASSLQLCTLHPHKLLLHLRTTESNVDKYHQTDGSPCSSVRIAVTYPSLLWTIGINDFPMLEIPRAGAEHKDFLMQLKVSCCSWVRVISSFESLFLFGIAFSGLSNSVFESMHCLSKLQ